VATIYKFPNSSWSNCYAKLIIFDFFGNTDVHAEMLPEKSAAHTFG
jgi:hypothetical protein